MSMWEMNPDTLRFLTRIEGTGMYLPWRESRGTVPLILNLDT